MNRRFLSFTAGLLVAALTAAPAPRRPNIVVILADDLGYGDVGCYNPRSKIPTPNLDRLAREGLRFTDAHSAATVCTPSRYSLLTGRMCFRTGYRGGVFTGVGGPSLIEAGRLTLPEMLRRQGYATAAVGKWHVGLTFQTAAGTPIHETKPPADLPGTERELARIRLVDFSKPITDGPVHRGFDHFFGTACCPTTDWLYAYIENDRVPVPPTTPLDAAKLPRHPYANDCRRGLVAPGFEHEQVDLVFLERSRAWLKAQVKRAPEQPFFLYHATQAPHLPSFAAPRFQGATQAGPHGDFIAELDHVVGELLATLEQLGVADNTLILFSSDNGPETTAVAHMRTDHDHDPASPWRIETPERKSCCNVNVRRGRPASAPVSTGRKLKLSSPASLGRVTPSKSAQVASRSHCETVAVATPGRTWAGQRAMKGTRWPPSQASRFMPRQGDAGS